MLFTSYAFIFLFLPITLGGYHWLGQRGNHRLTASWLVLASLFYYSWWNPPYLFLILASILFNFVIGNRMAEATVASAGRRLWLIFGVSGNLGLLIYYKYTYFLVSNLNLLLNDPWPVDTILLPLGISFFTFQQIAYLVDVQRGVTRERDWLDYSLFVTFFPELLSGPIVHHAEMLGQFKRSGFGRLRSDHLAVGMTLFLMGMFKKVVISDGVAGLAAPIFDQASQGVELLWLDAWIGALAYTFQLYFDFSGYSDMAIGVARLFGIRLPLNFNSPYQAVSIIDFWRRWHMTLSRFLRDYLYIALGGNRHGEVRRYINLMLTMLLGGIWHGAGWNFLLWGGMHGLFLAINHLWQGMARQRGWDWTRSMAWRGCARLLTFFLVVMAWVPFRAETTGATLRLWRAMLGITVYPLPEYWPALIPAGLLAFLWWAIRRQRRPLAGAPMGSVPAAAHGRQILRSSWRLLPLWGTLGVAPTLLWLASCQELEGWWLVPVWGVAWFAPNVQQILRRYRPAIETYPGEVAHLIWPWLAWRPTPAWAMVVAGVGLAALSSLFQLSEFLYFKF